MLSIFLLGITAACDKAPTPAKQEAHSSSIAPRPQDIEMPPTVVFEITRKGNSTSLGDLGLFDCRFQKGGKTARFGLEVRQLSSMSGDIPMAQAEGRFIAFPESDNSVMLRELRLALEAKIIPHQVSKSAELRFDAVILAEKQSRSGPGEYADTPRGSWTMIKVFLPKGGDDGEVFLNLSPEEGKAELSIKDSDYADYLLGQFAKVL